MNHPRDYQRNIETIAGVTVRVTSYRLGDNFMCAVDNFDPGAIIARGKGLTREDAERAARERLAKVLGAN